MPITVIHNVPLMAQPTDGVCWFMCARMCYAWQLFYGKGSMINPFDHKDAKEMYERNSTWAAFQNDLLADWFKMKKPSVTLSFDGVTSALSDHGPIWTAGLKTWAGSYGHVVAIVGVADTGVLIHDPMPLKVGEKKWLTWSQIKKYVDGEKNATTKFLSAA